MTTRAPPRWGVVRGLAFAPGPVIRWTLAAWVGCAVAMGTCRGLVGPDAALLAHAALVPIAFFAATLLAWSHDRHPGAAVTCLVCPFVVAGAAIAADVLVLRRLDPARPALLAQALGGWVPLALALVATLAAAALLRASGRRRRFLAWTAAPGEQRAPLPGDGWLDGGEVAASTRAITIRAPPEAVWAVVGRIGAGPAGFRTYDAEGGEAAAGAAVAPGQRLAFAGHGAVWFEVLEVDAPRHLVLGCHLSAPPVHGLAWAARSPKVHQRATWAFALRAAGEGTRLLARVRVRAAPPGWWTGFGALFPAGHLAVERLQLLEVRRAAERMGVHLPSSGGRSSTTRSGIGSPGSRGPRATSRGSSCAT